MSFLFIFQILNGIIVILKEEKYVRGQRLVLMVNILSCEQVMSGRLLKGILENDDGFFFLVDNYAFKYLK